MKVYMLENTDDEPYTMLGTFATENAAKQAEHMAIQNGLDGSHLNISEVDVLDEPPLKMTFHAWKWHWSGEFHVELVSFARTRFYEMGISMHLFEGRPMHEIHVTFEALSIDSARFLTAALSERWHEVAAILTGNHTIIVEVASFTGAFDDVWKERK
jgi:hypothetical protein